MKDQDMINILSNFNNADTGKMTTASGEVRQNTAKQEKDAMKALLEGLDAQQRSVNQMPGNHTMAKNTPTKHPAKDYLVGDIHGEEDTNPIDEIAPAALAALGGAKALDGVSDALAGAGDELAKGISNMSGAMSAANNPDPVTLDVEEGDVVPFPTKVPYEKAHRIMTDDEYEEMKDRLPPHDVDFTQEPGAAYVRYKANEEKLGKKNPSKDVYKKQSLADIFKSMEEAEAEKANALAKEFHSKIKEKTQLKKTDNGKYELDEDRADAIFDLKSVIKNIAYFGQDESSIEEEFKVNNGDTFVALAKKIVAAVKHVREQSKVKEDSPLKVRDPRAAQIIKKARNEYSISADDDLGAVVNMMHDKDRTHDKEIDNNADVNDEQEIDISSILRRLDDLEGKE